MCWQEGTISFCFLLVHLGLQIKPLKSELCLTAFIFLGIQLVCGFLCPDKLDEIWELMHSLLQTQPVMDHQANFCVSDHLQLQ